MHARRLILGLGISAPSAASAAAALAVRSFAVTTATAAPTGPTRRIIGRAFASSVPAAMSSSSSPSSSSPSPSSPPTSSNDRPSNDGSSEQRRYPPSRSIVDPATGSRYRLCVAAAVLRSTDSALLIGERVGLPDSWQCPQGGVDDVDPESDDTERRARPETVREAAARELYEEMGLRLGEHVEYFEGVHTLDNGGGGDDGGGEGGCCCIRPVRYETKGTGSWLERSGYAGQELHWALFRCIDARCEEDPAAVCDLSGLNGERPEFTDVKWQSVDEVVKSVWEKKREPYVVLANFLREKGIDLHA